MITVQVAIFLSLLMTILNCCSYVASGVYLPLLTGVVTGIVLGNPAVGLQVGATCTLMSLGFYTYGGAAIPDYSMGAVFGVVIAIQTGAYSQGIIIASVVGLLGTWFNILQGMLATAFLHAGEKSLAKNNIRGFELWHLNGLWTVFVTCFIPIFVGLLFVNQYTLLSNFMSQYSWIEGGLNVIGEMLPAVGFGLLLSYMDIKKYWPFLMIGFVMYAYMNVKTMGLALLGIALAYIFAFMLKKNDGSDNREVLSDGQNK